MKMDDLGFLIKYLFMYSRRSGFDCANFVSQCLEAGGMEQNDDWYYYKVDNKRWATSPFITSPSFSIPRFVDKDGNLTHRGYDYYFTAVWTVASAQYEYFSNPKNGYIDPEEIIISSAEDILFAIENYNIQKGDLLYFENKKGIHHATIISSVTEDSIFYAGHTKPRFDYNLRKSIVGEIVHIIRLKDYY